MMQMAFFVKKDKIQTFSGKRKSFISSLLKLEKQKVLPWGISQPYTSAQDKQKLYLFFSHHKTLGFLLSFQ